VLTQSGDLGEKYRSLFIFDLCEAGPFCLPHTLFARKDQTVWPYQPDFSGISPQWQWSANGALSLGHYGDRASSIPGGEEEEKEGEEASYDAHNSR